MQIFLKCIFQLEDNVYQKELLLKDLTEINIVLQLKTLYNKYTLKIIFAIDIHENMIMLLHSHKMTKLYCV